MFAADDVKGFTLIELLIVLVIMSLLLSLVPPLLSSVMPSVTLKATANDLYHDIKYVRNMAILKGRQTSLTFNPLTNSYSSDYKDSGAEVSLPGDVRLAVKSIAVNDFNDNHSEIKFFVDGSSTGGLILLSTEDNNFSIDVDWLTGKVTLLEGPHDEKI